MANIKKTVSVAVEVDAKIAAFESKAKDMKRIIDGLDIGKQVAKGLESNFTSMFQKIEKLKDLTSGNTLNLFDEKATRKTMVEIDNLYSLILNKMKGEGIQTSLFEKDHQALSALKNLQVDYAKATRETVKEQEKLNKAIETAKAKQVEKKSKPKKVLTDTAYSDKVAAVSRAELLVKKRAKEEKAAAEAANARLEKDPEYKTTKAKTFPQTKEGKGHRQATQELNDATAALAKLKAELEGVTTKSLLAGETEALAKGVSRAEAELQKFISTTKKADESAGFENLKKDLLAIEGINWADFGIDPSSINSVEEFNTVVERLGGHVAVRAQDALEQLNGTAASGSAAMITLKKDVHGAADAASDLGAREKEIKQLKDSLLSFFSIGNAVQLFKRAIGSAFETVKELDAVMTQTAVVTDFTVGDMWSQLPQYAGMANDLGVSIKGVYEATTLYYQQGLKTNEVMAVTNETLKMAKIAGMDYAQATDYMTAALRGFNMEINEASATRVNDVYSELAAITASDTTEISIAMTKTASIAKSANMEFETTAAFLSQIIETTRESAETAGTAMKTVIARFQELKKDPAEIGEVDGELVDANKIEKALRSINVALRGTDGQFRDLDDVFIEIAEKWQGMDTNTQRYIATMAAGSRQQSRFIAMMSDYGRSVELIDAANNSAGASQKQFEKTADSLASKLNKLKTSWSEFTMGLANSSVIKVAVDLLTALLNTLNGLTNSFGQVGGVVTKFLLVFAAFKGGKALLKGQFLQSILGDDISKMANLKGKEVGSGLVGGIVEQFKKSKKITARTGQSFVKNLFQKGTFVEFPDLQSTIEAYKTDLYKQIGESNLNDKQKISIGNKIIKGDIQGASAQAEELGFDLDTTKDFSEGALKLETNWRAVGAAIGVAGVALSGFGSMLKSAGFEKTGKVLSNLGTAAMVLGSILSVALPLMAKAGADSITASFLGIPVVGWILGIVAALTVLGTLLADAWETPAEKMVRLAETTKAAKEAAEGAKAAYDNLISSLDSYDSAAKNFEDLVKGTDDWKKALMEVNDEVFNLLATYPELAKHIKTGESGELIITEVGKRELIEKGERGIKNTRAAEIGAQIAETKFQGELNQRKLFKAFVADGTSRGEVATEKTSKFSGFDYEKENLDAMYKEFKNSPEKLFAMPDKDGKYSEALEQIAKKSTMTAKELYGLSEAFNDYDQALFQNQLMIQKQQEALLMSGASAETLAYEYGSDIVTGFAKGAQSVGTTDEIDTLGKKLDLGASVDWDDVIEFETLAAEYGVTNQMTGKDVADLETLYAAMANLAKEDIPAAFKGDRKALGQEIAKMSHSADIAKELEAFRGKMDSMESNQQRELGTLLSGDTRNLTSAQLVELKGKKASSYAAELGYESEEAMAKAMGYVNSLLSSLSKEDQETYAATEGGVKRTGKMSDTDYQAALDKYIESHGDLTIDASVQLNLKSEQIKEQLIKIEEESVGKLKGLRINSKLYEDSSIEVVKALADQTEGMSNEAAQAFIRDWNKAINSGDLGSSAKKNLENYLSQIDWSNLDDATKAMQEMQNLGLDPTKIQNFWDSATSAAGAYVHTVEQALGMMERFMGGFTNNAEALKRLEEGTGTKEDVMLIKAAGIDIEANIEATRSGFKLREEVIREAEGKLSEYLMQQAESNVKIHRETVEKHLEILEKMKSDESANKMITKDEDGEYVAGDLSTLEDSKKRDVAKYIGTKDQTSEETKQDYFDRLQVEFNEFIDSINNAEVIDQLLQKLVDFTTEEGKASGLDAEIRATEGLEETLDAILAKAGVVKGKLEDVDDVYKRLAISTRKAQLAMDKLNDGIDDQLKVIKAGAPGMADYDIALGQLKENARGIWGEGVDSQFITDNIDLFTQLAQGGATAEEAFRKIGLAAGEAFIAAEEAAGNIRGEADDLRDIISSIDGMDIGIGGTADFSQIFNELVKLLGGVAEAKAFIESLGYQVDWEIVGYETGIGKSTGKKIRGRNGDSRTMGEVQLPIYKSVIKNVGARGTTPKLPGGGGGGGGGGGSKEPATNTQDKFYNLAQDITAEEEKTTKIAERYNQLLENRLVTGEQLRDQSQKELESLEKQKELQEQMSAGREQEMRDYLVKESALSQYATFNWDDMTVEIDWGKIDLQKDADQMTKITDHISRLEEIQGQMKKSSDSLSDIQKQLREIRWRGSDQYTDLESRVLDALLQEQEKLIEEMSSVAESVDNASSDIIDSLQKNIDKLRQDRDNERTEEDIAEKERRLAYLRQDTSGANALEIKELEEELRDDREAFQDTLIDQAIADLQDQNDAAAEQRDRQINLAQAQLDESERTGFYANQATNILRDGFGPDGVMSEDSDLYRLLYESESADSMANATRENWKKDLGMAIKQGFIFQSYLDSTDFMALIQAEYAKNGGVINDLIRELNDLREYKMALNPEYGKYESYKTEQSLEDKLSNVMQKMQDEFLRSGGVITDELRRLNKVRNEKIARDPNSKETAYLDDALLAVLQAATGQEPSTATTPSTPTKEQSEIYIVKGGDTLSGIAARFGIPWEEFQLDNQNLFKKKYIYAGDSVKIRKYKKGGLADFTGPAWLDGSKSAPELVLNAKDTENFIQLKNMLSGMQNLPQKSNEGGTAYFDINIEVGEMGEDYDVEQMADKIKQIIYTDTTYRNVNTINLLR